MGILACYLWVLLLVTDRDPDGGFGGGHSSTVVPAGNQTCWELDRVDGGLWFRISRWRRAWSMAGERRDTWVVNNGGLTSLRENTQWWTVPLTRRRDRRRTETLSASTGSRALVREVGHQGRESDGNSEKAQNRKRPIHTDLTTKH